MTLRRHKVGFTLVEVMIVIFALGVLSAMIMISSSEAVATAKATKIFNDMTQIKLAVIQWYRENPYKVGTNGKVGTQTLGDYFKTDKGKAELMKHIDSTSISLNDDAVGSYTVDTSVQASEDLLRQAVREADVLHYQVRRACEPAVACSVAL